MTKKNVLAIAAIVLVVGVSLATALAYVSLLGENRKIDDVAGAFLERIKNKQYVEACYDLPADNNTPFSSSSNACTDAVFLLELSLLKQFNLLDSADHAVVAERNRFWVPFFRDGAVSVNILLKGKAKKPATKDFSLKNLLAFAEGFFAPVSIDTQRLVHHLLTVERRNGMWRITNIDVSGNALAPVYAGLRERLGRYGFPEKTRDGFTIDHLVVSYADLTPVDKRILKHNLRKIEALIDAK